jgi:uncharacterized membrane protein YbhN (UPF0104 family)/SAM-dependent methyltransferase
VAITASFPRSPRELTRSSLGAARSRRRRLVLGAKVIAGVLLLFLVLYQIDSAAVGRLLLKAELELFALACLLLASGAAVNAWRWRHVMIALGHPIHLKTALVGNFEAMFFNQLLPTSAGGDVARMLRAYNAGVQASWSIVGVLLDRALGLWFVALCLVLATVLGGSQIVAAPAFHILSLVSAVVLAGGAVAAVAGAVFRRDWFPLWAHHLVTLTQAFTQVLRSRRALPHLGGTLLASAILTVASFMVVARALAIDIDWWSAMIILMGMVLASVIPVSIGGWGIREGVAILLFASIGLGPNEATAVAVLFGLVLTIVGLSGGLVWAASGYRRLGSPQSAGDTAGAQPFSAPASSDCPTQRKCAFRDSADRFAAEREAWINKNAAYYADDRRYMAFLVPTGGRVLDIGCGTGSLLASLAPSHGVGLDFSARMISEARRRHPGLHFIEGDAEDPATLASIEGPFDHIVISDTIGMFEDVEEALKGLHRFCTAETRVVIAYYSPIWEPLIRLATVLGRRMPQPQPNLISTTDFFNILDLAEFEPIRIDRRQLVPADFFRLGRVVNRFLAPLPGLRRLCLRTYVVARSRRASRQPGPSTSIVIPCRNEHGNIERAICEMPRFGCHQEIIFVEGNSTDGTLTECLRVKEAYAHAWDIKVVRQDGKGKGDAVRKGFAAATGDILMILDADLTVPPAALPKFYEAIARGKGEFINGTRLIYPMEKQAMRPLNHLANRAFASIFSYLLNQRFTDTLCGTKALRRADYEKIAASRAYFGDCDPFGDFDLIFGAAKANLRILEVPVHYLARRYGETQISRFRDGWLLLRMVAFAFRKLKAV